MSNFNHILKESHRTPESRAYELGKDCAINGANDRNCHFSIFRTPEMTKEWERGKRDGEQAAG